jgi:hypothetical protein
MSRGGHPITIAAGLVGAALAATVPFAPAAAAAGQCTEDWRGDRVCIETLGNRIDATHDDYSPMAIVYLSILRSSDRHVVAGPVEDRQLAVNLLPGSYSESYYVQTVDFGDTEVNTPVVRI